MFNVQRSYLKSFFFTKKVRPNVKVNVDGISNHIMAQSKRLRSIHLTNFLLQGGSRVEK